MRVPNEELDELEDVARHAEPRRRFQPETVLDLIADLREERERWRKLREFLLSNHAIVLRMPKQVLRVMDDLEREG